MSTEQITSNAYLTKDNILMLGAFATFGVSFIIFEYYIIRRKVNLNSAKGLPQNKVNHIAMESITSYHGCIYMDYNATTPIYHEVYESMLPYLSHFFGNPSSNHIYSKPCREAILQARINISNLFGVTNPNRFYITSCGTESDNRAIDIALHHFEKNKTTRAVNYPDIPHIITCVVEHPAILVYLKHLESLKQIKLSIIGVNNEGFVSVSSLVQALTPHTALVTIMHSNNEVGTIQPIREIAKCINEYNVKHNSNILFHSDGAQSVGKCQINLSKLGVDLFTIVGHKFGAPKGIAALYVKEGIILSPFLFGGGQEQGIRAGTENVAYLVGLGEACRLAHNDTDNMIVKLLALKQTFISGILKSFNKNEINNIRFNGPLRSNNPKELQSDLGVLKVMLDANDSINNNKGNNNNDFSLITEQLPNTISISFKGIQAYKLIDILGEKVACSAGSACHSDKIISSDGSTQSVISDVLKAMDIPCEYALGTLRISLGKYTTEKEIDTAIIEIVKAVKLLWSNDNKL
eukprot:gene6312-8692_t